MRHRTETVGYLRDYRDVPVDYLVALPVGLDDDEGAEYAKNLPEPERNNKHLQITSEVQKEYDNWFNKF